MAKSFAWIIAGAVFAAAGAAHAQEAAPVAPVVRDGAELPWYQRFSSSTSVSESVSGADRLTQPAWTLSQRWGVTVDVREARRVQGVAEAGLQPDQTAVGAYYQFTPRVRLGGEVSLTTPRSETPAVRPAEESEPAAGVRIQSAFRF